MQRLQIATVVTRFVAGAGGVALRGALALDPDRYQTTVLSADGGPLLDEAADAGLRVVRLEHMRPEINPGEDARALRELMEHLSRNRYDIVHTHSAKAGALGRLAARRVGGMGVVHTYHGFPFHSFQGRTRRTAYLQVERRLATISDAFLAIGTAVAADIVRLRIGSPEKVRVVAPAVRSDLEPCTPSARRKARYQLQIPPGVRVIGTVGRLDLQKAPVQMLEALALLERNDSILVWVGDGPQRPVVERAIHRLGLQGRVLLLGERSDIPDLLPAFDVFAMSSLYEGLPCALVEAMMSGIPVVATAVNSVPDVVVPGRTGVLVPPDRPAALAAGLRQVLDDPVSARQRADAALRRVSFEYAPELLGRDLDEVYQLVCRHRAVGGASNGRRLSLVGSRTSGMRIPGVRSRPA